MSDVGGTIPRATHVPLERSTPGVEVTTIARAEDVHTFWFADVLDDPAAAKARNEVWFRTSRDFDAEIRTRFEPTIAAAARGELNAWEARPGSAVALVIVLDQFPRNVYRNTPGAFAHDALALGAAKRALAAGHFQALSVPERTFVVMPYQHVEDVAGQEEGVRLFERVRDEAPAEWKAFAEHHLGYARGHLEIVRRFGRFPHRNGVLGRESTPAELEYLESKPESFGQGVS